VAAEVSTIQSLKAVDAWIDVINANINGGVRTAYKASRLKFAGANSNVDRTGTTTSLPLQFPEPALTTANTVIDFSQGAITASSENTHLAIQGEGFFILVDPGSVNTDGSLKASTANTRLYLTRDGEFHTNQSGLLVHSSGYVLTFGATWSGISGPLYYGTAIFGNGTPMRAVYNNVDSPGNATVATKALRLTDFILNQKLTSATLLADGVSTWAAGLLGEPLALVPRGIQSLQYAVLGSTVFDVGFNGTSSPATNNPSLIVTTSVGGATILTKSLEASNASMTQSVPELSLAQKLFSALTKVLQTKQTNVDGVLNLVR
jgi:flagellar hook protein FlgE